MPETHDKHNKDITARLQQVIKRVRKAELSYGRAPESVQILPVSKTRPAGAIAQVARSGFTAFGESYAQEAMDKIAALAKLNLQWHFIGPIQSNKSRLIAGHFHWVHSVDREKIARRLNDQRPENFPPLDICLQINISGEFSKSGVKPPAISELAARVMSLPRLRLRGLMTIPAPCADFEQQRKTFAAVHEVFTSLQAELEGTEAVLDTLSMGMSNDLEAAIAEGSTLVRVGTDIFGPRKKKC